MFSIRDAPRLIGADPTGAYTEEDQSGDNWRTVEQGLHNLGGVLYAFGSQMARRAGLDPLQARFDELEYDARLAAEDAFDRMSPVQQRNLNTPMFSGDFWKTPAAVFGAKFLQNLAPMAIGTGVALAGSGIGGLVGAGIGGGLFGAAATSGDFVQNVVQAIDETSDADLLANPYIKARMDEGMDLPQARQALRDFAIGDDDLITAAVGMVTGMFGPETLIANAVAGTPLRAALSNIGKVKGGAAGGIGSAGSEAIEEAAPAIAQNAASERSGGIVPEADVGQATLEGAALGFIPGAIGGAIGGRAITPKGNSQVEKVEVGTPTPAQVAALGGESAPPVPDGSPETEVQAPAAGGVDASPPAAVTEQAVPEPAMPEPQVAPEVTPEVTQEPEVGPTPVEGEPVPAPEPVAPPQSAPETAVEAPPAVEPTQTVQGPSTAIPEAPVRPTEVTPIEVTPIEGQPVPAPEPGTAPMRPATPDVVETFSPTEARQPRILEASRDEALWARAEAGQRRIDEATARQDAALAKDQAISDGTYVTKRKDLNKAQKEKRFQRDPAEAQKVFDATRTNADFSTPAAAIKHLTNVLEEAKRADITIPKAVTKQTPDQIMWLVNANKTLRALKRNPTNTEALMQYVGSVAAAAEGDWSPMRMEHGANTVGRGAGASSGIEVADPNAGTLEEVTALEDAADADVVEVVTPEGASLIREENADAAAKVAPSAAKREMSISDMTEKKVVGGKAVDVAKAASGVRSVSPEVAAEIAARYGAAPPKPTAPKAEAIKAVSKAKDVTPEVTQKAEKPARKPGTPKTGAEAVADIKKARAETTEPKSKAQADAGNYRKGHFNLAGLRFSMENKKGSVRRSKDPDNEWEATVPADYGYINGVVGADGDNMDVFVGSEIKTFVGDTPDAQLVYVIDQVDPDSQTFDEHKVMMGFKDVSDAVRTYERAFSDGRGLERFGGVKVMDLAEFKEWIKTGDTTKSASDFDTPRALPSRIEDITKESDITGAGAVNSDYAQQVLAPESYRGSYEALARIERNDAELANKLGAVRLSGHWFQPVETLDVGSALDAVNTDKLAGVDGVLDKVVERLRSAASNVPVYVLNDADVDAAAGRPASMKSRYGGFAHLDENGNPYIVISEDIWGGEFRDHTVVHEAIHAATMEVVAKDPEMEALINRYLKAVADYHGLTQGDGPMGYGLSNIDEFMAELANPKFRELLMQTPVPREMANKLGLAGWRKATAWNTIVDFIRRLLGMSPSEFHAMDLSLSLFDRYSQFYDGDAAFEYVGQASDTGAFSDPNFRSAENHFARVQDRTANARRRREALGVSVAALTGNQVSQRVINSGFLNQNNWKRTAMRLLSNDAIMRNFEHLFPDGVLRAAVNATAKRFSFAKKLGAKDAPVLDQKYKLFQKYNDTKIGDRTATEVYEDLLHDQSNWGVDATVPLSHANNAHLGKNALRGVGPKAQHPRLFADFNILKAKAPELADFMQSEFKYYRDKIDSISEEIMTNAVLDAALSNDNNPSRDLARAVAKRIMAGDTKPHDIDLVGKSNYERLEAIPELKKIKGPYVPQMRFGDFIVNAEVSVADPNSGSWDKRPEKGPAVYEFKGTGARKAAEDYVKSVTDKDVYATVETIHTDAKGNEYYTDPDTGKSQKYLAEDAQAETRYRVNVQNRHTEFFETEAEAQAFANRLKTDGGYARVDAVTRRKVDGNYAMSSTASRQLAALAESFGTRSALKGLPPTLASDVKAAIYQASYRAAPGTSMSKRRMMRKHVAGASRDSMRVMQTYSIQANNYLASLQTAPEIEQAFKALDAHTSNDYSSSDNITRRDVINELVRRRDGRNGMPDDGGAPAINMLVSVQTIDKLMSPAYSLINMLQVPLVSAPYLASKHGVFNASRELGRAASDIGFTNILQRGGRDTWEALSRKLSNSTSYTDFVKSSRRFSAEEKAMFDALVDVGAIDPDSGFEAVKVTRQGAASAGLQYMENAFRQFPRAVEAMNRHMVAVAAYRLARKKGASHESAVNYAQDAVNETQFNYSPENSSPMFNHPLGRVALQFKKFGMGMYQLLGAQIVRAIKGMKKGERAEAMRMMTYTFAAHALMSGVLGGLPTEPLKVVLTALNMAGITQFTWNDVEIAAREIAAEMVGPTVGEALMRGMPRLVGMDISTRVGLNNLMVPNAYGDLERPEWRAAYMYQLLAGPAGGMIGDAPRGIGALAQGDMQGLLEGMEYLIPVKGVSDILKAARYYQYGKETSSGDITIQYSAPEALLRAFGIAPGREADVNEFRDAAYSSQTRDQKTRQDLLRQFYEAAPTDRFKVYSTAIKQYNQGQPPDRRISFSEARNYSKNKDKRFQESDRGVPTTDANKRRLEELRRTYPQR